MITLIPPLPAKPMVAACHAVSSLLLALPLPSRQLRSAQMRAPHSRAPPDFVDWPFDYLEEVELEVQDVTNLGDGVARVVLPSRLDDVREAARADSVQLPPPAERAGWVVLVPFTLPGEKVVARIQRNFKRHSIAEVVEVRRASPRRREPLCRLFGECGGCQYQHVEYAEQLQLKRKQVCDTLVRIGGLHHLPVEEIVLPAIGSPQEYRYRSKLTPHLVMRQRGKPLIGFLRRGSTRQVLDVTECPIAMDAINEALLDIRNKTRRESATPPARSLLPQGGEARRSRRNTEGSSLLLRATPDGVFTTHNQEVTELVGHLSLRFKAGDFFQNNPFILPKLVDYVVTQTTVSGSRYLIDAFSGSGLFALSAAHRFEKVMGVETCASAVECATRNADSNGICNVRFLAGDAESIFDLVDFPSSETAMVIDPPRKGCDPTFISQLLQYAPRRIVYVSCGPDTQVCHLHTSQLRRTCMMCDY